MTSVYVHTCPNGKKYVGIADNPETRWANGHGYADNAPFAADIRAYGWDNIKHEIIVAYEEREEALCKEAALIYQLNTIDPQRGYNRRIDYERACYAFSVSAAISNMQMMQIETENIALKRENKTLRGQIGGVANG